jgi:hypothetical protein
MIAGKISVAVGLSISVLGPCLAVASSDPSLLTGRFFSDVYVPQQGSVSENGFEQASFSAWVQSDPVLNDLWSLHITLTGDAFAESVTYGREVRGNAREAYFQYSNAGVTLKAGRIIIPWGKTDGISPTDLLTATDYAFFNPDNEVRRIGSESILLSWTPNEGNSKITFTGVFTALAPRSSLLLPSSDVGSIQVTDSPNDLSFSNMEGALKVTYNGDSWDGSILGFMGRDSQPIFQLTGVNAPPQAPISATEIYDPIAVIGNDFSLTSGRWVFRQEAAYTFSRNNPEGTNATIEPGHFDFIVGVEHPLGELIRVQFQSFFRFIPTLVSPADVQGSDSIPTAAAQQIAYLNALILGYQSQFLPGGTLRLSYLDEKSGFGAEIFAMAYFTLTDYLVRPMVDYTWTDALKTSLGLEYYGGPNGTPLNAYSTFNAGFFEARFLF